ncbi:DISARM system helicase DrmA [Enterobacter huaxiensis]|uniref:DISARM system helicase DrmA n=1 Tax=Enterobacter huaxiensis TaxID=2494702 RepID=UPI001B30CAD3|nr:DISARM system helicase DrmA [Enterobacter huaxiensis]
MPDSSKRESRSRILEALERELMGPTTADESINEFPTTRYIIGRLAPLKSEIPDYEKDELAAGNDDDEGGGYESQPPLIVGFSPSSMGLSFLVSLETKTIHANAFWGDYRREKHSSEDRTYWKRYQRSVLVEGIPVDKIGKLSPIPLSKSNAPASVTVTPDGFRHQGEDGDGDGQVFLEGVVHHIDGAKAVSLFLVNRRPKGDDSDKAKDQQWLMQPKLQVFGADKYPIFIAKDFDKDISKDPEIAAANMLYRDAKEFATGHGVAAGWDGLNVTRDRASLLFTDFIPNFEVPSLIAQSGAISGLNLDMWELSQCATPNDLFQAIEPLVLTYEKWVADRKAETQRVPFNSTPENIDTSKVLIECCKDAARRMREGLELIRDENNAFEAFLFSNHVMWDQRIHAIWAGRTKDSADGKTVGSPFDEDINNSGNRTWRPFQMGFILLNIASMVNKPKSGEKVAADRKLVDLLWFPTGGGKTEAYLGLAAFTLAYRRLRGDVNGLDSSAGVSIIMRYTLRLLTVQQFQRATALICACELVRKSNSEKWGQEPFKIGLWVGKATTPNDAKASGKALEDLDEGKKPRDGSPVQLVSCPRCGTSLVTQQGKPENQTYDFDNVRLRTLVRCPNPKCEFCARKSNDQGLPVVVVDDEIYRECPSLVIATVDKFARMPFKGETQALFGLRDRYSPTYGHLTPGHGEKPNQRVVKDAQRARRLVPPELIIQDELHLISGPLGTMVGLYETAVDFLTRVEVETGVSIPAKIIASTATIRRAREQIRQLYNRDLSIFPPSGLSSKDSFFAKEQEIKEDDDKTAGRLYVGLNAPGSSTKTLLVRVYAALLAAGEAEITRDHEAADPYATVVGYFNSLRALGGARRLVEDDIKKRLRYLSQQRGFPQRYINDPDELTSRLDSWRIPGLLKRLDNRFPREQGKQHPVDVLLATNMISVGVDIDRLGLMVVTGQPKSTAEYIQATSRVGRKHPGLVITMYNWLGARDLSHYEHFRGYHAALYRYVEAISVTPFSSRALDRGLRGAFAAMQRLGGQNMAREVQAQNFDPAVPGTDLMITDITLRAADLVGKKNAKLVNERLMSSRDDWAHYADDLLRYSWLKSGERPPNNARVLLKTSGTDNEGQWYTPGSLREVEPTAAFYLSDEE